MYQVNVILYHVLHSIDDEKVERTVVTSVKILRIIITFHFLFLILNKLQKDEEKKKQNNASAWKTLRAIREMSCCLFLLLLLT